jgi:hypothetical protein
MAQQTDWIVEPRERGWLTRFVAPQAGDRPSSVPLLLGALGAASFVASLALDWQRVTVAANTDEPQPPQDVVITTGLPDIASMSLTYVLGGIALLALVGAVAPRPETALRIRMAAMGAGVGMVGILIATTIRMPDSFMEAQGPLLALFGGGPDFFEDRIRTSYEPGIFFGYAAVILPLLAIWLAGRPAARFAAHGGGPMAAVAEPAEGASGAESAIHRVPRPDGPLELTVTSDDGHPH